LLIVKDSTGHAAAHNITLQGSGGATIDGISTFTMNGNYNSIVMMEDALVWYIVAKF
jgi:hypothetical protein